MKQSKKGFTLVEMMLVVAIIVILAGTAIVSIGDSLRKSQESQDKYQEHALLVDSARDNIHTMMHVNPPVYTPAPPTNNPGGNPGVGGGGTAGGEGLPVGGGGGAPTFEEPEEAEPEVTEPEETEPEVTEPEVTEPEAGSGSGSGSSGSSGDSSTITTNAPGTHTSAINYWNNEPNNIRGYVSITTDDPVTSLTIVVPDGLKVENLDWRYSQKKLPDGQVEITYTADPRYHEKISSFDLQFTSTTLSSLPANTFVVVSYN